MKKNSAVFLTFILTLFLLIGCNKENNNIDNNNIDNNDDIEDTPITQSLKIGDYFPIKGNVKYIYEGEGNEYASYDVVIDYTSDNKVQQRVDNGGTIMAKVFEIKDGELRQTYSRAEVYYRENMLDKKDSEEILLMEPLEEGTTWTLGDGNIRTITSMATSINVPAGSFEAIEVETVGEDYKIFDYYAKNIGLVKTLFQYEDFEVTSSLSKIEENFTLTQSINFYYPNIDDGIYFKSKEISFQTNDITKKAIEDAYKLTLNEKTGKVFSENTQINSLYLNDDGMAYIDLNKSFVNEMNAGAGYEAMILQSIANTIGDYYGTDKVILTIEGQPYASGHIVVEKGEYLEPNYNDLIEIN